MSTATEVATEATEVERLGDAEFRWGTKGGVSVKNKDVQFYKSFTYDGIEYSLYDCVYMSTESEAYPYIGKLIRIWEHRNKSKRVRVQWFLLPSEVQNWINHHKVDVMEKEIFLISGKGLGVSNENPLEAIGGKCNVVCTSLDVRNPQPSEEQVQMADYLFYRTFDVGSCTISETFGDKVGDLDVKFVFNRKENEMASGSEVKGSRLLVEVEKEEEVQNGLIKLENSKGVDGRLSKRVRFENGSDGMEARNSKKAKLDSSSKISSSKVKIASKEMPKEKGIVNESSNRLEDGHTRETRDGKIIESPTLDKGLSKEKHSESTLMPKSRSLSLDKRKDNCKDNVDKKVCKLAGNNMDKALKASHDADKEKHNESTIKSKSRSLSLDKGKGICEENPDKKIHKPTGNNMGKTLEASHDVDKEKNNKSTIKPKSHSFSSDKGKGICGENLDTEVYKLAGNNVGKALKASHVADEKIEGKKFKVTRRPDVGTGKWFTLERECQSWEKRIRSAHEEKTLVLLQNLDPDYTSGEVEDIVWSAFKINCEAKVVQMILFSSPHSGQALVIFKKREEAERVIRELSDGCLILPNQRPLIGRMVDLPKCGGKQSTFAGHLSIDKIKMQMQREMKDALSTSHCSQPNTIEYDLAMEWCLMQSRFAFSWKALYKQQGEDLEMLMASFKSH